MFFSLTSVRLQLALCFHFQFFSSLSLENIQPRSSLSFFLSANRPPSPSTTHTPSQHHHHLCLNSRSTASPSGEIADQQQRHHSTARHLPTATPATTGLRFRRHNDQKNHHDLLYSKVLAGTSFVTLEKKALFITFFLWLPACSETQFASRYACGPKPEGTGPGLVPGLALKKASSVWAGGPNQMGLGC